MLIEWVCFLVGSLTLWNHWRSSHAALCEDLWAGRLSAAEDPQNEGIVWCNVSETSRMEVECF